MVGDSGEEKFALVQGDFHMFDTDAEELLARDMDRWDVVMVEGREPGYSLLDSRSGFWYYAIGSITMRTIVNTLHRIFDFLGISKSDRFEDKDIEKYDRIDAQHREIWGFTSWWFRWSLLIFAAGTSITILIDPTFLEKLFPTYTNDYPILFFYPIIPILVHLGTVVNPTNSSKRNDAMAESIDEYAEDNDYNRILVLVGEMHRNGIVTRLEERGWNVDSYRTNSRIGMFVAWVEQHMGKWK